MSMIERVKREVAYVLLQIFCSYSEAHFKALFEALLLLFCNYFEIKHPSPQSSMNPPS